MRLDPDQDALDFGASVRDLLADSADSAALRAAWDSDDGRIPGLWKRLADVGVLGSTIPEDLGGLGLDARSVLPVLIESGRAALPEPLIETLVGSSLLAAVGGPLAERWLPLVAEGGAVLAVGLGPGELVSAAPWADLFLLRDRSGDVHAVEAADVTVTAEPSVDQGIRLARLDWQPTPATRLPDADAEAALDLAGARGRGSARRTRRGDARPQRPLRLAARTVRAGHRVVPGGQAPARRRLRRQRLREAGRRARRLVGLPRPADPLARCLPREVRRQSGGRRRGAHRSAGSRRHRLHLRARPAHVDEADLEPHVAVGRHRRGTATASPTPYWTTNDRAARGDARHRVLDARARRRSPARWSISAPRSSRSSRQPATTSAR